MKRKNIHTFDSESIQTLKTMILSSDKSASKMGIQMLKNANLDDEETLNQLQLFSQVNIMDWYEMDAETMKSVLDVFVDLENRGFLVKEHKVELSKTLDGNDIVNWMDVQIAAKIEKQFVARKALAEEWLDDNCTDERKEAIEIENSGKKVEFKKNPEPVPEELTAEFNKDLKFKKAFHELTPGRQRGYIIFFSQPKSYIY